MDLHDENKNVCTNQSWTETTLFAQVKVEFICCNKSFLTQKLLLNLYIDVKNVFHKILDLHDNKNNTICTNHGFTRWRKQHCLQKIKIDVINHVHIWQHDENDTNCLNHGFTWWRKQHHLHVTNYVHIWQHDNENHTICKNQSWIHTVSQITFIFDKIIMTLFTQLWQNLTYTTLTKSQIYMTKITLFTQINVGFIWQKFGFTWRK